MHSRLYLYFKTRLNVTSSVISTYFSNFALMIPIEAQKHYCPTVAELIYFLTMV